MVRAHRPIIDAAISEIHAETGRRKLRLRESFRRQPAEVARTTRQISCKIAGHDLVLPLVELSRSNVRLDRNDLGLSDDQGQVGGIQTYDEVDVIQDEMLAHGWIKLKLLDQLQCAAIGGGIGHQL